MKERKTEFQTADRASDDHHVMKTNDLISTFCIVFCRQILLLQRITVFVLMFIICS